MKKIIPRAKLLSNGFYVEITSKHVFERSVSTFIYIHIYLGIPINLVIDLNFGFVFFFCYCYYNYVIEILI